VSAALVISEAELTLASRARTFRWAAGLLPARAFRDAAVVYALCRLVDDLADEPEHRMQGHVPLDRLRAEVTGYLPPRPIVAAFLDVCARTGLPTTPMVELIEGCRTDLSFVRFESDDDVVRYGYQVAGTVGLMMCAVLGVTDPRARPFAIDLGVAMQITNICRDVAEDASNGRVYLPAKRLAAVGVSSEALLAAKADPAAVGRVIRELLDIADRYYESAILGYTFLPWRVRPAIAVAARVYRGIGGVLRRRGCDPWSGRAVVGAGARLLLTWSAFVELFRGTQAPESHDDTLHVALQGRFGVRALHTDPFEAAHGPTRSS
jgi:phytoene synthase